MSLSKRDLEQLDRFADQQAQAEQFSEVLSEVPPLLQRGLIYLIFIGFLLTAGVLYWGQVSVIVSAPGVIAPQGEGILVTALEAGVVTEIDAKVGDRLKAGNLLLRFDPNDSNVGSKAVKMTSAGTIAELKIKHLGEVLSPGDVIAVVIPEGASLVINAEIRNKDIGFITEGLKAQVKIDAYPFEQFGTLPAEVIQVFPNVGDTHTFKVTLRLPQPWIQTEERRINLFPGLTVTAEIATHQQRLFDVILGPSAR